MFHGMMESFGRATAICVPRVTESHGMVFVCMVVFHKCFPGDCAEWRSHWHDFCLAFKRHVRHVPCRVVSLVQILANVQRGPTSCEIRASTGHGRMRRQRQRQIHLYIFANYVKKFNKGWAVWHAVRARSARSARCETEHAAGMNGLVDTYVIVLYNKF